MLVSWELKEFCIRCSPTVTLKIPFFSLSFPFFEKFKNPTHEVLFGQIKLYKPLLQ